MTWQHFVDMWRGELSSGFVTRSLIRLLLAAILAPSIGTERRRSANKVVDAADVVSVAD